MSLLNVAYRLFITYGRHALPFVLFLVVFVSAGKFGPVYSLAFPHFSPSDLNDTIISDASTRDVDAIAHETGLFSRKQRRMRWLETTPKSH